MAKLVKELPFAVEAITFIQHTLDGYVAEAKPNERAKREIFRKIRDDATFDDTTTQDALLGEIAAEDNPVELLAKDIVDAIHNASDAARRKKLSPLAMEEILVNTARKALAVPYDLRRIQIDNATYEVTEDEEYIARRLQTVKRNSETPKRTLRNIFRVKDGERIDIRELRKRYLRSLIYLQQIGISIPPEGLRIKNEEVKTEETKKEP